MVTKTKKKKVVQKAIEEQAPNIQFVGKTKLRNKKTVEMPDAPKEFNSGGAETVKLPSTEEQKAGFYIEPRIASQMIREHPTMYKRPTILGSGAEGQKRRKPIQKSTSTVKAKTPTKTKTSTKSASNGKVTDGAKVETTVEN